MRQYLEVVGILRIGEGIGLSAAAQIGVVAEDAHDGIGRRSLLAYVAVAAVPFKPLVACAALGRINYAAPGRIPGYSLDDRQGMAGFSSRCAARAGYLCDIAPQGRRAH